MFTGLIEEVGTVVALGKDGQAKRLEIAAPSLAESVRIGDSVAVNGCCLTVALCHGHHLTFDVLHESLGRTNLKNLPPESRVNLELALSASARLGGHFVQGPVDCAPPLLALGEIGADLRLEIDLPAEFAHYVAYKGSVAVNGISLTVAEVLSKSFATWIIPHTKAQ